MNKSNMETLVRNTNKIAAEKLFQLGRQVGNTPLLPIRRLFRKEGVSLYAKAEWQQLSGSVKARAAFNIIRHAIESGELGYGKTILDATSGNTGIAYATIGFHLNIPVALCLPENASPERISILESLGAEIIYTSKFGGTDEAQEVAAFLANENPDKYFYADQYRNTQNWEAHYKHTAVEIYTQLPSITHFVAGLGTTGTFTGTSRRLKEFNSGIEAVALQPDFALHGLEGWKHLETAVVPGIYDEELADRFLEVSTEEAHEVIKNALKLENLLLSPSSAANLAGAIRLAKEIDKGNIVTVLPDNADKYGDVIKKLL